MGKDFPGGSSRYHNYPQYLSGFDNKCNQYLSGFDNNSIEYLGGFDNHSISSGKAGGHLPREHHQWVVPGGDESTHSNLIVVKMKMMIIEMISISSGQFQA